MSGAYPTPAAGLNAHESASVSDLLSHSNTMPLFLKRGSGSHQQNAMAALGIANPPIVSFRDRVETISNSR